MQVQELWVEVDGEKRCHIGDSGWYEAFSNDKGELFKAMQKHMGGVLVRYTLIYQ